MAFSADRRNRFTLSEESKTVATSSSSTTATVGCGTRFANRFGRDLE
jgi:hypothetical protein